MECLHNKSDKQLDNFIETLAWALGMAIAEKESRKSRFEKLKTVASREEILEALKGISLKELAELGIV